MLIDAYAPEFDFEETHRRRIQAPPDVVYDALWGTDFAGSRIVGALLLLRSLPRLVLEPRRRERLSRRVDLEAVIEAGFGKLAETPGEEIVLGVTGRFWRPTGNLRPFEESDFRGPVSEGAARAVWNFSVRPAGAAETWLETQTRVTCADAGTRRKFGAYWFVVRPFSGWIRRIMLRRIESNALSRPSSYS